MNILEFFVGKKNTRAEASKTLPIVSPYASVPQPAEPVPLTDYEARLLNDWYERKVAKYAGAEVSSDEIYRWGQGYTLIRFMQLEAVEDVNITQDHMIELFKEKGHHFFSVCGKLHFKGIRHLVHGDVTSHNYMT